MSGNLSLEENTKGLTWEKLKEDATHVVDQYTDTDIMYELRKERRRNSNKHGDMVYENAVLFMHDALLLHEFTDAIKYGDSGRVILVLKVWVHSFRGQGQIKYMQEVLYLLHNLTHVWPPSLRYVHKICTVNRC